MMILWEKLKIGMCLVYHHEVQKVVEIKIKPIFCSVNCLTYGIFKSYLI